VVPFLSLNELRAMLAPCIFGTTATVGSDFLAFSDVVSLQRHRVTYVFGNPANPMVPEYLLSQRN
jgi:hypothetical protein